MERVTEQPKTAQVSHTPAPVRLAPVIGDSCGWIDDAAGLCLAMVYPGSRIVASEADPSFTKTVRARSPEEVRATAARMVLAYNCHDELLAALKVFATDDTFDDFPAEFQAMVNATIAKAEGK